MFGTNKVGNAAKSGLIKPLARIGAAAWVALLMTTASASAFTDQAECTAEITKLVQDLLKANVSSEQVNHVYEAINQAEAACTSGDLVAGETAVNTGKARLREATGG